MLQTSNDVDVNVYRLDYFDHNDANENAKMRDKFSNEILYLNVILIIQTQTIQSWVDLNFRKKYVDQW